MKLIACSLVRRGSLRFFSDKKRTPCFVLALVQVNSEYTPESLLNIARQRVGADVFAEAFADISQSEAFMQANKSPQPSFAKVEDVLYHHPFAQTFRQVSEVIVNKVREGQGEKDRDTEMDRPTAKQRHHRRGLDQSLFYFCTVTRAC